MLVIGAHLIPYSPRRFPTKMMAVWMYDASEEGRLKSAEQRVGEDGNRDQRKLSEVYTFMPEVAAMQSPPPFRNQGPRGARSPSPPTWRPPKDAVPHR